LNFKQTTTATTTVKSKKKSNVLNDLIQTRFFLTQKLKGMKSIEMDRINMLESTFKPITKPLNVIAENFLKQAKKGTKTTLRIRLLLLLHREKNGTIPV